MVDGDVKIEIYKKEAGIQGTLDLYTSTNFPLAINYGIKNIVNINETTGTYSKTLRIPATKNNNKVLKNIGFDHSINIESLLDNSIECRVSLNTNVLVIGSLQVKGISSDIKLSEYEVTILGSNVSWGKVFSDEYMCDVSSNFDDGQTRTWTNGLWKSINDNVVTPFTDAVFCLPVICWGAWQKTFNHNNYINKMDLSEVRPAYFIKNLVTDYFNSAGYNIQSTFFNTLDFSKLIIPITKEDWEKIDPALEEQAHTQAEFDAIGMTGNYTYPNAWNLQTKARYIAKDYEGGGADLFLPFDIEHSDLNNNQQIAVHVTPPTINQYFGGTTFGSGGFTYDTVGLQKNHQYIVPADGTYNIKSQISYCKQSEARLHFEIHLYRDYQNLWVGQPVTSASFQPFPNNHLYRKIMIGGLGGNPELEPIVLDSYVPSTAPLTAMLQDQINDNALNPNGTTFPYEYYNYEQVDLDSGDVQLYSGDMIMIFCINDWSASAQWINNDRGKAYIMGESTPEWFGGFHKVWNYPPTPHKPRKTTFEVNRVGRVAYGDNIHIGNYLSCKIPKIDLIKAITGMFNLYWTTDELARVVYVEPYNNFYKSTSQAVDMSSLIDYSKPQDTRFILDEIGRNLYFKYAKDSADGYVDEIEKNLDQEYHSLEVDIQDGFRSDVEVIGNKITAPTYMINDWELSHNTTASPRIPLIVGEYVFDIEHSQKPLPLDTHHMRILAYEGMQSVGVQCYGSWDWQNINNGLVYEYPQASTHHPTDNTFTNLDYADNSTPGLYTTYWKAFIDKLSDSPRIKSLYMNLQAKDISMLDFTKPIFINDNGGANGGYWLLHRIIDYKPHNQGSTKVELLQYYADSRKGGTIKKRAEERDKLGNGVISISKNGDGRTNESFILKSNNYSPSHNGNVMLGNNLSTRKKNQIILGQYNKEDDDAILIIGGGTSLEDRRNVLVVDSSGTVHLGENGGGAGIVTKDENGNIVEMYTEKNETITKVIKG